MFLVKEKRKRKYFNPRSYKRSDMIVLFLTIYHLNFNPRSYKRSDRMGKAVVSISRIFQSTLLQEERLGLNHLGTLEFLFQSTLLQEERHLPVQKRCNLLYFNPRSYKRSDMGVPELRLYSDNFNPRSYKRSDGKNAQLSLYLSVIIIA